MSDTCHIIKQKINIYMGTFWITKLETAVMTIKKWYLYKMYAFVMKILLVHQ